MKTIEFQGIPIDTGQVIKEFGSDSDGAIVNFIGRARNMTNGKEVMYLEYEIYEKMALQELEKIVDDAFNKWSITNCRVIHRYGKVNIGEESIVIFVSSPHRDESFQAARYIIDTIKKTVPVWKKEFYTDGSKWISDRA